MSIADDMAKNSIKTWRAIQQWHAKLTIIWRLGVLRNRTKLDGGKQRIITGGDDLAKTNLSRIIVGWFGVSSDLEQPVMDRAGIAYEWLEKNQS